MKEIWKDIAGYEGLYQVSNLGRVKNVNGVLKLHSDNRGYLRVMLTLKGKRKNCRVHRLVAESFVENPECKPHVNHKDGNKHNNCIANLEWCTPSENIRHARITGLFKHEPRSKPVDQFTLQGEFIRTYPSTVIAARLNGINAGGIQHCCNNKYRTSGGYIWAWH